MPKLIIRPSSVLLTSGQAATFEAVDDQGNPVDVAWTFNPAIGSVVMPNPQAAAPAGGTPAPTPTRFSSATYVAPLSATAQMVSIIGSGDATSGSATVSLTPDAMAVIPAKVELKPNQSQQFVAVEAGAHALGSAQVAAGPVPAAPASSVKWILNPPFGTLSDDGLYQAPADVPETTAINITAANVGTGKQATATVSLSSLPWTGTGVQLLAAYILLVFALVVLIVFLWPPALPSADAAKADRILAESTLKDRNNDLDSAQKALAAAQTKSTGATTPSDGAAGTATRPNNATSTTAAPDVTALKDAVDRADKARQYAQDDLEKKRNMEEKVNNPEVDTKLGKINRELDLLWLVLLAGSLGAFLHMSQSISDYIGNRTLKDNWAWWYYFRPFIGAGLAFVFYAAVRGGVIAIAAGTNVTASGLNPFGVVSTAALVGMFSRAATMKLGEVFDTLFKTDKVTKDKLASTTPTQPSTGTTPPATSTSAGTK